MKLSFRAIALALLLVLAVTSQPAVARKLTIAAAETPPYTGKKLIGYGLLSDIATTALMRAGHAPRILFLPWKRALAKVKQGEADVILGVSKTYERRKELFFSDCSWPRRLHFYAHAGHQIKYTTPQALCPRTLGLRRGSHLIEYFERFRCPPVKEVRSISQGIEMLARKRIDVFLESSKSVSYHLNNAQSAYRNMIERIDPPWKTQQIYIAFSKAVRDHALLAKQLDTTIKNMQKDGTFQALMKVHGF